MPDNEDTMTTDTQTPVPPTGSEAPPAKATEPGPQLPTETPAAPGATSPVTVDWESDENPHKFAASQLSQTLQQLQSAMQQVALRDALGQEVQDLKSKGASDADIEKHLALRQREAYTDQREGLVQEAARIEVARRLSLELKSQGFDITQDELMQDSRGRPIQNGYAMAVRADTLMSERGKAKRTERVASGADKVPSTEKSGGGIQSWKDAQKIARVGDLSDADYERFVKEG